MSKPVDSLDPIHFPLYGSRLIEASAGTGKTFTIALLYVRLVLGQADASERFPPPLTPKQILVVTFTELAAGELRDRIRARLVEAAEYFLDPALLSDPLLVQLREQYPPERWKNCAWRLQTASQSMDEASVATIHSWCNRMLVEHAFDTQGLFNREMLTDSSELLAEVVEDYWRQHYYDLSAEEAAELPAQFLSPQKLREHLRPLLQATMHGVSFNGEPVPPDPQRLRHYLQQQVHIRRQQQAVEQAARTHWAEHWDSIHQHLLSLQPHLNGSTHGNAQLDKFILLLDEIEAWAKTGAPAPTKLKTFASGNFKFKTNARIQQEEPLPAFELMRQFNEAQQQTPDLDLNLPAAVLSHAGQWVKTELTRRMQHNAQLGFDDLLVELEHALDPARGQQHALQLADTLRRSFPIALIDEFQDTDPIQYGIFNRIYQIDANREDCGIFMIGDPKQSIYAFRGADIHTYLQARSATAGRHYTLKKNFRSTLAVVQACNDFFGFAEQHPKGAFRFRSDQDDPVPFIEVEAKSQERQLLLDERPAHPLTLWYFNAPAEQSALSLKQFRQQAAALAASQIAEWLQQARAGRSGFGVDQVDTPLRPADIAILVRSGREARLIRQELSARNIPSVYLSDRESVFASQQAADCLHWLRACAEPTNEALVRAALGTFTMQLPLAQLAHWQEDELAREQQMLHFVRLREVWRRQGVLVMLNRLQEHYQLPARLMRHDEGERMLTNLLHLGEWLQTISSQLDGEQALIRQLREQLGSKDEQQLLRLESDAQRVQILTIHKSKGLEYPLVVLPFIGGWQSGFASSHTKYRIDDKLYAEVAGKTFIEGWQAADEEQLQEDLRLLYVALTRASFGLWLGIGPLAETNKRKQPELEKSAIGHILNGSQAFANAAEVRASIETFAASAQLELLDAPAPSADRLPPSEDTALEDARPAPQLGRLNDWWVSSYSALRFSTQTGAPSIQPREGQMAAEPQSAREDQLLEHAAIAELESPAAAQATRAGTGIAVASTSGEQAFIHDFPRGTQWGTFLHGVLEWAALAQGNTTGNTTGNTHLRGFAAALADDAGRDQLIRQRCRLRNIEALAPALSAWLKAFLQQRWPQGFALADIAPAQLAVELEFMLEIHHTNTEAVDALIRAHTARNNPDLNLPRAEPNMLNGLLKGYIDLVIEHQGRYYVIDWKSNHLGADEFAYDQTSLQKAIHQHRYDVQYVLYILALHRHLKLRLPAYDYQQHIGGAIYSFVRGWQNPHTAGLFHDCPPQALIEQLDQLFARAGQGDSR